MAFLLTLSQGDDQSFRRQLLVRWRHRIMADEPDQVAVRDQFPFPARPLFQKIQIVVGGEKETAATEQAFRKLASGQGADLLVVLNSDTVNSLAKSYLVQVADWVSPGQDELGILVVPVGIQFRIELEDEIEDVFVPIDELRKPEWGFWCVVFVPVDHG